MSRLLILALAGLVACACYAEPRIYTLPVAMGAATGNTGTLDGVSGYLDEVYVSCSDGSSTGTVYLAYVPVDGITPAVNVATGEVTAAKVWRPRIDATDVAGADLTSDAPGRVALAAETLRLIVLGSPTNKTWKASIKVDR